MFIISDIHGEVTAFNKFFELDEKFCLQLGDFGLIFSEKKDLKEEKKLDKLEKRLASSDRYIFTVLGNHDCWPRYFKMEEVTVHDARCWKIRDHILAVIPGEVLVIEGQSFLCIGGADSHDKAWRLSYEFATGVSIWWPEEAITQEDIDNACHNLAKFDNKVDFVCTHCTPYTATCKIVSNPQPVQSELLLDKLLGIVDFDEWFCGHLHENILVDCGGKIIDVLGIGEYVIT